MTITLDPQVETRLRRKAERIGEDANALAAVLLSDALADEAVEEEAAEQELNKEYRHLVGLELHGTLSEEDSARLRQVTQKLDDLDMQSPAAQFMFQRLGETGHKLDEMLALLRGLPLGDTAA